MMNPDEFKEILKYINKDRFTHSLKMSHEVNLEVTKEGTLILPLPKNEKHHEPFIELPIEYILSINGREFLSYKAECPCGEMIVWNKFGEN